MSVFLCCNTVCASTASVFTLKNPAGESVVDGGDEEEDDFQTDEDEEMEVEKQEAVPKRKKVCGLT